jgi:hypothetical protein
VNARHDAKPLGKLRTPQSVAYRRRGQHRCGLPLRRADLRDGDAAAGGRRILNSIPTCFRTAETGVSEGNYPMPVRLSVGFNQDPGQAGEFQISQYSKLLQGYLMSVESTSGRNKETAAEPWVAQLEHGKSSWLRAIGTRISSKRPVLPARVS